MSKHTPGPWQVGTKHHHNACQVYAADGQDAVCMVYDIWHHRNVDECKDCKGMANARLIASAPELLEALKELLRVDDEWHGSVNSEMAGARQKARKAIAKAEGKQ